MQNKEHAGSSRDESGHKMSYRDIFDQSLYDETGRATYPARDYSDRTENEDSKQI